MATLKMLTLDMLKYFILPLLGNETYDSTLYIVVFAFHRYHLQKQLDGRKPEVLPGLEQYEGSYCALDVSTELAYE